MTRSRRAHAADSGEKLRRIRAVADAALSNLDVDSLLKELLERVKDVMSVDTAAILLLDPAGRDLVATAAIGLEDEIRQGIRVPLGEGFTGRIAALARPMSIEHVNQANVYSPVLLEKHVESIVGVPMLANGRVIGVLHVGSLTPRTFTDDDVELLQLVADRASLGIQARMSQLERATTLALQRSLLPARPPRVDGLEVAVRYIPGAEVGVGGDWYDVFALPSGYVGLVIGDVAGNGLRAAVVMGRIRSALRAYALESDDPADVLDRLDRKIQLFEPDAMATAAYAVIDPTHTKATISLAGHVPPVLIDAAGARILSAPIDLPLGSGVRRQRHNVEVKLPKGSAMLLYTDGLIERRYESLDDRIAALLACLNPGTAEELCNRAAHGMLQDAATDDVAILAVRLVTYESTLDSSGGEVLYR
jgi:phosphoserine phosphatase RsbU/P